MKKNFLNLWLMAALVCGLSLSVASCKDDDNNGNNSEQTGDDVPPTEDEASLRFWSVVGQLVAADDYTEDYQNKTFEPTIGSEDTNPQYRVVYTNDAETAAQRFAYLVNEMDQVNEQTTTYTWSDPEVGTLTYKKVTDGTAWATVDVSIKQVPKLEKIIYRQPAQDDANGSVGDKGSAYYRFGDVISRTNKDGKLEYWICVRPAFGPEGKGDTHWVSVSPLPTANQKTYTSSHKKNYILPTGLKTDQEHMQNLAEMLYAIYSPEKWYQNIEDLSGKGLKIFNDFQTKYINYHHSMFWKNVAAGWQKCDIAKTVFGLTDQELGSSVTGTDGLYTLYDGYSWYFTSSNYCSLYQAHYVKGSGNKYANMHTNKPYTKPQAKVVDTKKKDDSNDILIDITECTLEKPYYVNEAFFGDAHPRFIVRTATGKELSNTGKYTNNQLNIPGCTDVYRFYRDVYPSKDLNEAPEETFALPVGEAGTYMIGDVVKDYDGNKWICIAGAPYSKDLWSNAKDSTAWFISFDKPGVRPETMRFVPEDELTETGMRLMLFIQNLKDAKGENRMDIQAGVLGNIGQHVLDHAGVDLRKLVFVTDSIWTYTNAKDGKQYDSKSSNYIFNVAYGNSTYRDDIPVARFVFDYTQAGNQRGQTYTQSGKNLQNWRYLCYTKYETYDPTRITVTEDEKSVGMTAWNVLWPMSDDKMMFTDIANQAMVDKYAKGDKWHKLAKTYRTEKDGAILESYYWDYDAKDFSRKNEVGSLYSEKEPVLFFHVMKVTDNGGIVPNLKSQAGTPLQIVHLQNDHALYSGHFQSIYAGTYCADAQNGFYLNNQPYVPKLIPGF